MVSTHPLKNPQTINFISIVHNSPPTRLLLQGETFPRRGEKHLAVNFLFFFSLHFSTSLYSISMSENKQLTVSSLENRCIASHGPSLPLFFVKSPKIKRELRAGWRHRYIPPNTTPRVTKHRPTMHSHMGVCSS